MLTIAIIAGVVILIVTTKRRRRRPSGPSKTVTVKTTTTRFTARPAPRVNPETERRQREREEMHRLKKAQAADDLIHHEQQMRDLLKLYGAAEAQYENAKNDARKEAAFRKMYSLDRQMRTVEKQRERAKTIASM